MCDEDYNRTDNSSVSSEESYILQESHPSSSSPDYKSTVWAISCRPVSHTKHFSDLTLMFRPDTRLFCNKGQSCVVPNDDHHRMYCHALSNPKGASATPQNPHGVSGVECTWTLSGDKFVNDALDDDLPRDSKVVFYVHGHRTRFFKFTAALAHLNLICNPTTHAETTHPPVHVVGFLWPCHGKKVSYGLARSKASNEGGRRFRHCIAAMQQRNNEVYIIAHSLGARVTLSALLPPLSSAERSEIIELPKPVQDVLLIGAALPSDAFVTEFPRDRLHVLNTYNFLSAHDEVLAKGYGWAERLAELSMFSFTWSRPAAMGSVGATSAATTSTITTTSTTTTTTTTTTTANMTTIPATCISTISHNMQRQEEAEKDDDEAFNSSIGEEPCMNIDVSDEVRTHSVHAYLASPSFRRYLTGIVHY
jgi:hypothetical protein